MTGTNAHCKVIPLSHTQTPCDNDKEDRREGSRKEENKEIGKERHHQVADRMIIEMIYCGRNCED
jgi:hypothetical protein